MSKPSFPDRSKTRRRAPLTPQLRAHRARALRHAAGGALLALALVALVVLHDVPVAALLASLTLVTIALVVVDPGKHLLATVAPLPDVHTPPAVEEYQPPAGLYAPHETALGEQLGVIRVGVHSLRALAESTTDTTAIPQARA